MMFFYKRIIAATAVEILQNPEIIKQAKAELNERLDGETYASPLADGLNLHKVYQQ
jgi:aminobenzoyl-glutamate utilization protein B